ncbi:hypothetical protein [Clostridium botulinum]|uniref:hypothetical protein n=1 Tax=Clostridium botulinum TaxID=1491 RepID=UPI000773C609|nr:hypothetical protein [Clostridium botulinum]NFL39672.1 hypothetical protein [Clostridium botulinum]NFL66510.1 hypothetical protein [Clostridium botulinum]NFN09542.1 hypothetical protein [Clostridium botulinum]NFN26173.1 hypothetical protein [Clostridium botulinum]NFN33104.1 hypothetical protein [Clostridium botulinum]
MQRVIKDTIIKFSGFILNNIQDILIIGGILLFIITMFKFVSTFVGYLTLSIVLIILGLIVSKIKS